VSWASSNWWIAQPAIAYHIGTRAAAGKHPGMSGAKKATIGAGV
jgi:hypothetical protein